MEQIKFLDRKLLVGSYIGLATAIWKICGLSALIVSFILLELNVLKLNEQNYQLPINFPTSKTWQLILNFSFFGTAFVLAIVIFILYYLVFKQKIKSYKLSATVIAICNLASLVCWIIIIIFSLKNGAWLLIAFPFVIFAAINLFAASFIAFSNSDVNKLKKQKKLKPVNHLT